MERDTIMRLNEKYKQLPKTIRAALWFTVCNFSLKGISFICMPLYTRLLPVDEYGDMSILTSYDIVFTILATFEIYLGAFQRGILEFRDDLRTFEKTIVLVSNVITAIWFFLVFFFAGPFVGFTGIPLSLVAMMAVHYVFLTPYQCWLSKKRFDYDYRPAVAVTLAMAIVSNAIPVFTIQVFGRTAYVKVATTVIVNSLFCLPFWVRDFDPVGLLESLAKVKGYITYALAYQFPLVFHSLSYYILNQSDRVMIGMFADKSSVALYSVAYSLANVIVIFQNSINQVLRPWRLKKLDVKSYDEVRSTSNLIAAMVGMAISCFMLVIPEVFRLLFEETYYPAIVAIPPVTASVYFLFLYTVFVDVESYYKRTNYIAIVSMLCAFANIVLNYLGLQHFGYQVCAYTTLFGYMLMAAMHYVFMVRTCRIEGVPVPVDSRFLLLFSVALSAAFVGIAVLYNSVVPRYVILVALAVFAISKKERIAAVLKEARV